MNSILRGEPVTGYTYTNEFYEAAASETLVLPLCPRCGQHHWYPSPVCPHCQCSEWAWTPVDPAGRLFTWTVVRHAFIDALGTAVPFVVALVELPAAPGVRLVTNIMDVDDFSKLEIGMNLKAYFGEPVGSDLVLPLYHALWEHR